MPHVKRIPNLTQKDQNTVQETLSSNQELFKQKASKGHKNRIKSLQGLKPISSIPSFILRTLNDAAHLEFKDLTDLQRSIIRTWRKAEVGPGDELCPNLG